MSKSRITYIDESWNPYTWNCHKVSEGCKFCYAERRALSFHKTFIGTPEWRANALADLRNIPSGQVVFVNTHSDTYHPDADLQWQVHIHTAALHRDDLIFLLLTKRPENVLANESAFVWPDNLWLGVSVELQKYYKRIDMLRVTQAKHKFLSIEPMLERMPNLDVRGIDWVICGGESGEQHRYFDKGWARDLWKICKGHSVPFFFKQGYHALPNQDRQLDGANLVEERPAQFHALKSRFAEKSTQMSLL